VLAQLLHLLKSGTARKRFEAEMDDEMRFHLETFEKDLVQSGVSPAEARRRAVIEFGSVETKKEECREARGLSLLDEMVRNVRFALRLLRRSPGFAATIILTLGLCIGANTAIFSVVDAVLFRPLPYPEPERLGTVVLQLSRGSETQTGQAQDGWAWEALKQAQSFDLVAASGGFVGVNLGLDHRATYVQQQRVSAGYFRVLGMPLAAGREFTDEEDRPGGAPVVILSHGLLRRMFHGDHGLIGRPILLRGEPHVVVGVAGESFRTMRAADLWTPLRPSTRGEGGGQNYTLIARLKATATWPQAQGETQILGVPALQQLKIPLDVSARMNILPLQQIESRGLRDRLMIVWAAVGVVLLIGCVNIAALMLARGMRRGRELSTRVALGGGTGSLIRQLFAETVLLGLLGGAAGLAIGYVVIQGFQMVAEQFGVWQELRLDSRVLMSTVCLSLLTGIVFGLAPAFQATRVDVRTALASGGSRGVAGGRSHWLRRALVVTEVALGLVLVIAAGLLLRTLWRLQTLSPGFDGSNVLAASVSLQDARYGSAARVNLLYRRTLEQLRTTQGVEAAAIGLHVPFERWLQAMADIPGNPGGMVAMNYVTPGYFQVLRIPLREGREIDERDTERSVAVAVVNEAFMRQRLNGQPALGSRVRIRMDGVEREVVGVVGNVRQRPGFAGASGPLDYVPAVYVPVTQLPDQNFQLAHTWFSPKWIVRGNGSGQDVTQPIQRAVESVDPLLPIASFRTLDGERNRALGSQRTNAMFLGSLAVLALALAAVGVYGLVANSVVERTRELGIRMTLGATIQQVIWAAVKPGLILSAIGVVIGSGLAVSTSHILKSALYGVKPVDTATFASVAALILLVSALASLIPALRLVHLNPARTLREE